MTDLTREIEIRAQHEICAANTRLFDDGELMTLQVIAVRLRRGIALTPLQRESLARMAAAAKASEDRR